MPMKEGESYETVGERCLTKLRDNIHHFRIQCQKWCKNTVRG